MKRKKKKTLKINVYKYFLKVSWLNRKKSSEKIVCLIKREKEHYAIRWIRYSLYRII